MLNVVGWRVDGIQMIQQHVKQRGILHRGLRLLLTESSTADRSAQKKRCKKPVRRSPDGLHMLVAGIGFEPMTFGL